MTVEQAEAMRQKRREAKRRQRKLYRIRHREAWKAEKKRWKKRRRERRLLMAAAGDIDALAWYEREGAARRRWRRTYYWKHRDVLAVKRKLYNALHPEYVRRQSQRRLRLYHSDPAFRLLCLERCRRHRQRLVLRHMADPEAYASFRAKRRIQRAKRVVRKGRLYVPRCSRRIPDWCVRGGALDASSPWLVENLTPSQRAYVRELAIERRKA